VWPCVDTFSKGQETFKLERAKRLERMKKADKAALIEAYRAKTWSGQIIQTRKKPVADTPIFKAMEEEKQLEIFNIK